jgi:3-isopropylmalate dehydrogenase
VLGSDFSHIQQTCHPGQSSSRIRAICSGEGTCFLGDLATPQLQPTTNPTLATPTPPLLSSFPVPNTPLRNDGPKARIAVIPGDGIGKEVTPAAAKIIQAACARRSRPLEFVEFDWSADRYLRDKTSLPEGAVEMLRDEFDAIHPRFTPLKDRTAADINLIVFRENTEGIYVGAGGFFKKGTPDEIATQEDINSRKGVERILRHAFHYAATHTRTNDGFQLLSNSINAKPLRLCMSDKSNAMTFAGDLWQRTFKALKPEYLQVDSRHLYIDTLAMEVVRDPAQFDVIVTNNLFGDIISDLASQLSGGLGLAPSGNIHPGKTSLFEPVHGSAPNIAGKGIANPFGSVLSSSMMLDYLGWPEESAALKQSVKAALAANVTTPDLGGASNTAQVTNWLLNHLSK